MPRPLERGDLRALTWGSRRWHLASLMRVVADQGYRSTGIVNATYAALVTGADVGLTADQLRGFLPESKWPADLDAHDAWVLSGDDALTPAP